MFKSKNIEVNFKLHSNLNLFWKIVYKNIFEILMHPCKEKNNGEIWHQFLKKKILSTLTIYSIYEATEVFLQKLEQKGTSRTK